MEKNINELGNSIDFQTLTFTKSNPVLDMLNVKYVIVPTGQGDVPITNPFTNGNAWFVSKIKVVKSADEEIKALNNLDVANEAVIDTSKDRGKYFKGGFITSKDSTTSIQLKLHKPNHLIY